MGFREQVSKISPASFSYDLRNFCLLVTKLKLKVSEKQTMAGQNRPHPLRYDPLDVQESKHIDAFLSFLYKNHVLIDQQAVFGIWGVIFINFH
jgi:hypothetical protein